MTTTESFHAARPASAPRGKPSNGAGSRANWLVYGDAMRVLGVLAVIIGHVADMRFFQPGISRGEWWAVNVLDAACRWAVPIFIMLSGSLLLNPSRRETASHFYRRRVARLGVAIAFWSPVFMLLAVYYTGWMDGSWDSSKSIWKALLKGQPYPHLHFVFRLGGLYLITPMLRVYVRRASLRLRALMAVVILGLGMANSLACGFLGAEMSGFMICWPFLGYYLAGDVMRNMPVSRRTMVWSCAGFLVTTGLVAGVTGWIVPAGQPPKYYPSIDMMMFDFLNPVRVVMAICAWNVLVYVFSRVRAKSLAHRLMAAVAPLTLGIYMIHPLFREILWQQGWLVNLPTIWLNTALPMAVVIVASFAVSWALYRIPVVRKIVC